MLRTRIKAGLAASVFTLICLTSVQAFACGESLFRVGKGMSYRPHTAPLPGNLVIVAKTDAHRDFAERLAAAGHHVRVADDANQLAAILEAGDADIVLAAFGDREVVAEQFASAATHATYLPVTTAESEVEQAEQLYGKTLAEEDSFTDFLKAIHHALKRAA